MMPTKKEIQDRIVKDLYNDPILNNSHRGDLVEILCLIALGPDWQHVGLGWHPWDLQRGTGDDRIRIQVKNPASKQLWGDTKKASINFNWSEKPPSYFSRDN